MRKIDLRNYVKSAGHPVLCLGPMSQNCIDAVIDFANDTRLMIPMIASRRQIEAKELGGGYVNNWDTRTYSEYVIRRDRGYVPLCRDHGGPWQGDKESDLSLVEAVNRAKISIEEDIRSGFDAIHIDPSVPNKAQTDSSVLEIIYELYAFTQELAKKVGRVVEIEIGSEQQSGYLSDTRDFVTFLKAITQFCEKHSFTKPLFCVVQTGTLVKEMRNVGLTEGRRNEEYDQRYAVQALEKQIRYLVDIAYINGVYVKEHNGDYLSDGSMALRYSLGLGGVNIAPELGLHESKCLVELCRRLNLNSELDQMLHVFYDSKKWVKWMRPVSDASDLDKAIIAGHYSFSKPEFLEIKARIAAAARQQQIDIDAFIRASVTALLTRFSWNLGCYDARVKFANDRQYQPTRIIELEGQLEDMNVDRTPDTARDQTEQRSEGPQAETSDQTV